MRYPLARQHSFLMKRGAPFAAISWPQASLFSVWVIYLTMFRTRLAAAFYARSDSQGQDLYPNGFYAVGFVSDQAMHAHSYRHAWFQPNADNKIPMPEGWRVKWNHRGRRTRTTIFAAAQPLPAAWTSICGIDLPSHCQVLENPRSGAAVVHASLGT